MKQPLVSLIIPFKNTAAFLPECLQSVIDQTYPNWEVLAVDDHSTDDSRAIVEQFRSADARIKVYNNTGSGIIPALRTGYEACSGEFISRMDSDDIMAPPRVEKLVSLLLEKGPGKLAVGQVRYFSDRGISGGYRRYEKWLNRLTEKGSNFGEIYKECPVPSPCWMAYRSDFEACGGFEPDRYPEDYDLCFRMYAAGLHCIPCQEVLHYWRDYDTRTSRTHEHYAQNYFLEIKMYHFLRIDYNPDAQLVLWGAGGKGKTIAKILAKANIPFRWVCDNPNKIGKKIYGVLLQKFKKLPEWGPSQSLVTVANKDDQAEIRDYFKRQGMEPMQHYFFFC